MRNQVCAMLVAFGCAGTGLAAHAQDEEIHTVWVIRNGSAPQPFFFGYGRTVEIAEGLAFRGCGADCTIIESGPGCVSIIMQNQAFYPRGCAGRLAPETPAEAPNS
jgi:hypothetical protein